MSDVLTITLFGGARIERAGGPVRGLASRKAEALLIYLACTGQAQPREKLATMLWDDRPQTQALGNLSVLLTSLRQQLGSSFLAITRQTIAIDPASGYWLDTAEFERRIQAARAEQRRRGQLSRPAAAQLEQAVALYQGAFLAAFHIREAREFEEWVLPERERLQRLAVAAMADLVNYYRERGKVRQGLELAGRWLALDPLHEEAHRQMMRLLALDGRRSEALAQYETCCRVLKQELGVEPDQVTTALYEELKRADNGNAGAARAPHSLEEPATPFIGRESELAEIARRLDDPDCHLLTLLGPGGIGKTRLALRAAAAQEGEFQHGVWFVPLTGLLAPVFLAPAIGDAIGLTFSGSSHSKVELIYYLHDKEMLIVLDNFEHLLGGASLVAELMRRAPQVKFLVTSRERLNLQAEWLMEIEGLPYPPGNESGPVADYEAVQLFVQSAGRVHPRFALTKETQPAVARICQLVAGAPLGIELAATSVRYQHPAEIAAALEQDLDLLARPWRDLPERHHSLRAVFDQSWQLLPPQEQQLLAELTIFRGGFSREAALAVTAATEADLAALVDKSLLRRGESGRFAVHELVRQFAAEKLAQQPAGETERRHSHFYLAFLAQRETALNNGSRPAIGDVQAEFENVQAAWQWAVRQGDASLIEQGVVALSYYYELEGLLPEGEAMLAAAAERVQSDGPVAPAATRVLGRLLAEQSRLLNGQAKYEQVMTMAPQAVAHSLASGQADSEMVARLQLGIALYRQASYPAAQTELEQALALARAAAQPQMEAASLLNLGIVAWYQGRYAEAKAHYEQCLTIFRHLQDGLGQGRTLRNLGNVFWSLGEYGRARAHYEQSLQLCRDVGNRPDESRALGNLGMVCLPQGDYLAARNYFEQSLRLFQEMGNRLDESKALAHLGDLHLYLGDYERARPYYERAVAICREIGDQQGECGRLSTLALTFHLAGDNQRACQVSEASLSLSQAIGDRNIQADALTHLGYALADRGRLDEAADAYQEALRLRRELGETHRVVEPLAGLAEVALAAGETGQALSLVEEILPQLLKNKLEAVEEPFRVYVTCHRILAASHDPRGEAVLAGARAMLAVRAAKINDEGVRRAFLENVPAHRAILVLANSQKARLSA